MSTDGLYVVGYQEMLMKWLLKNNVWNVIKLYLDLFGSRVVQMAHFRMNFHRFLSFRHFQGRMGNFYLCIL